MSKAWQTMAATAVLLVAIVAAVVSYEHLHTVALAAGEEPWIAAIVPLSADGLLVSASVSAFLSRRRGEPIRRMTIASLVIGLSASVAANIASPFVGDLSSQSRDVLAAIVGAWPAVALALSFEEALRLRPRETMPEDAAPAAVATTRETATPVDTAATAGSGNDQPVSVPEDTAKRLNVKAEALAFLAVNPKTSAIELAARFQRSDRWARMVRKEFLDDLKRPVAV